MISIERLVRAELSALLRSENAHMDFDEAVTGFPLDKINTKTDFIPYSPWHIIEHMRITQWDILEFIRNPDHVSPGYPAGYFLRADLTADEKQWRQSIDRFLADLAEVQDMASDHGIDLFAPIAHAPEYTIFRELITVADHNAYHTGELAIFRQELGGWPDGAYLTGSGRASPLSNC